MRKIFVLPALLVLCAGGLFLLKPRAVKAQSGCDATAITGTYGFSNTGEVYDRNGYVYYLAATGLITADGNGNLTGSDTLSLDGSVVRRKFTGTYAVNADCTGSAALQITQGTDLGNAANYDLVLADTNKQVNVVQTDSSFIFSGTWKKQ